MTMTFVGRLVNDKGETVADGVRLEGWKLDDPERRQFYPAVIIWGHHRVFEDEGFERVGDELTLIIYREVFTQWNEPQPHQRPDPYGLPFQIALREVMPVCIDETCELSGGNAHAGPCEPCGCSARHAVVECPNMPGLAP